MTNPSAQTMENLADDVVREMYSVLPTQWDRDCLRAKVLTALRAASAPAAVRDDWSCSSCGDRDVPEKFRVFGNCYKCAAQKSIDKRDRKIDQLKSAQIDGALPEEASTAAGEDKPLEVWHGERKVTVYAKEVLRVWGVNIDTEMSSEQRSHETVAAAFDWLYAAPPAAQTDGVTK